MNYQRIAIAIFAAVSGLAPVSTQACTGSALFEEEFAKLDPSWGDSSEALQASGGKATMKLEPNYNYWAWNTGWAFPAAADICLDVTSASDTADPKSSAAGLIFWVKDNANLYVFNVSPSGDYWVSRKIDGKWVSNPVSTQGSPENQTNSLRVSFDGPNVTLYINGKEQTKLRIQPPGASSYVGIYGQAAEKSADTWEFSKLKVTNLK